LALFGTKITLYRFNHGAHTVAGGLKSEQWGCTPCPLTLTTASITDTRSFYHRFIPRVAQSTNISKLMTQLTLTVWGRFAVRPPSVDIQATDITGVILSTVVVHESVVRVRKRTVRHAWSLHTASETALKAKKAYATFYIQEVTKTITWT